MMVANNAGVLVVAKRRSLLGSAKPLLDALIASGLRLNPALYQQVLSRAGE
jgi:predicted nucleic acid-binding protein